MELIIITTIICATFISITLLILPIIKDLIGIYKESKIPKQESMNDVVRAELNEMKAKLSSIELARGFKRNG